MTLDDLERLAAIADAHDAGTIRTMTIEESNRMSRKGRTRVTLRQCYEARNKLYEMMMTEIREACAQ